MSILCELSMILLISFISEMLSLLLPFPIPSSIYGILLLFTLLSTHMLSIQSISRSSSFLLTVMPLLFIPSGVGLMDSIYLLYDYLIGYLLITLLSTVAVMISAGLITQTIIRYKSSHGGSDHE